MMLLWLWEHQALETLGLECGGLTAAVRERVMEHVGRDLGRAIDWIIDNPQTISSWLAEPVRISLISNLDRSNCKGASCLHSVSYFTCAQANASLSSPQPGNQENRPEVHAISSWLYHCRVLHFRTIVHVHTCLHALSWNRTQIPTGIVNNCRGILVALCMYVCAFLHLMTLLPSSHAGGRRGADGRRKDRPNITDKWYVLPCDVFHIVQFHRRK